MTKVSYGSSNARDVAVAGSLESVPKVADLLTGEEGGPAPHPLASELDPVPKRKNSYGRAIVDDPPSQSPREASSGMDMTGHRRLHATPALGGQEVGPRP